jgi:hypothetical protein
MVHGALIAKRNYTNTYPFSCLILIERSNNTTRLIEKLGTLGTKLAREEFASPKCHRICRIPPLHSHLHRETKSKYTHIGPTV